MWEISEGHTEFLYSMKWHSSIFEIMHDFWKILIANMTYTKWNYITMVVGEHGIQTLKVVVIVLLFLSPQVHIP